MPMKTILIRYLFLATILTTSGTASSQGWVAEFDLDFNHDLYAFEKIIQANLTFSGFTVTGTSPTSKLQLTVRGTGPISGDIKLSLNGLAWEPYYRENPESESISATFAGSYKIPCITGFFQQQGETTQEQVYMWVRVYPRMEISEFTQKCDKLNLSTNTCSRSYLWEISDSPLENFKTISGKTTSGISITRDEIKALGFANPYGRKYFRVTGIFNTTSQLQAVDIYYPGPSATLDVKTPKCHNGQDGSLTIDVKGPSPAIDDFVVTLFKMNPSPSPIKQDFIFNGSKLQFSGLASGPYMIRAENNSDINTYGNCWSDHEFIISNPDPVIVNSAMLSDFNGFQIKCDNGSDGRIEIIPSGGTGIIASVEWTPAVSNSFVAENLTEGSYQVKIRDSNDCWSGLYTYEITAPDALQVRLQSTGGKNGYDVTCHNKNDGEVLVEVEGGATPYSYEWSDGTTQSFRTNMPAGLYTLKTTDANGCERSESIGLTAPDPITFTIEEIEEIRCRGLATGALEVQSVRNTIGTVAYVWSSGETQNTIYNKPAGTYSVTVSDDQGCNTSMPHSLTEPDAYTVKIIPLSDFNGSQIRCNGETNGSLTAIVSNDEEVVTQADHYEWNRNGDPFASGQDVPTLTDLASGIYRVTITYRTVCKTENIFILNEPDPVGVVISEASDYNGVPISCFGKTDGNLIASASGGVGNHTYLWNGGQETATLSNVGAAKYTVTATDVNGCKAVTEKVLEDPALLQADIAILSDYHGLPISCTDASDGHMKASSKGGTPPFSYEWNSGLASQEVRGLRAGTYTLTVRDANGCAAAANATLQNPSPVQATIAGISNYNGFGVSCFGSKDGYLLAGGTGGTGKYTFKWEGSTHTNALKSNLEKGEYTVIVTDENGCHSSVSSLITEPIELSLTLSSLTHPSCYGSYDGEFVLSAEGGIGNYQFSVSGQVWQSEWTLTGLRAGTYSPRVQDANGCGQSISATVSEPSEIKISFQDIKPALCEDASGEVSSLITGGTGKYTYDWRDTRKVFISDQSSISRVQAGIYTLTVTDENRCEALGSVGIAAIDGPKSIVKSISPATCSYSLDGSASVDIIEGNGPFTFSWPDGQQTPEGTRLPKGEHLVRIQDINGCITVQNVSVPGPDSLEVALVQKSHPTCFGVCDGKLAVSATGGNGGYSYQWKEKAGTTIDGLCAGEYVLTVSDEKNCSAIQRFQLVEPEPLMAEAIIQSSPTCPGGCDGSIEVNASGGTGPLRYDWSDGKEGPVVNNLCSGIYTTLITDSNNCMLNVSSTLEEPVGSHLELGGPLLLCEGQTHILDAGPQWKKLLWESDAGFRSDERQVHLSVAGIYSLEAIDQRGCLARDTFVLKTSDDLLRADFLLASEAIIGDTIVLIDISWPLPDHISWSIPDEMSRLHDSGDIIFGQFQKSGIFEVTLKAILGECNDQVTKVVTIIDDDADANEGSRLDSEPFVKGFTLFPNPNEGIFEIVVDFLEESFLRLTIWNSLTSKKLVQIEDSGSRSYSKNIDLRPLSAGPYTVRLDYTNGSRYLRFIVR